MNEISFHPSLDQHSVALAKRRGRTGGNIILYLIFFFLQLF